MKKPICQIVLPLILLLITGFMPVFGEDINAEIVDLYGEVSISRNGEYLDEYDIDYGTEIYAYDMIQTGPDGYVEIAVETPVSPEVVVKVLENTTLFMDHAVKSQSPQTSFNLQRGAVQTRAAALIQGGQLNIKTDSSVMGVRGTVFSVVTSPDTALLVTCREGKVVCNTDGEDAFIQPGRIYEKETDGAFQLKELNPDDIDSYINQWQKARMDALMINGAVSLEHYANLYLQSAPGFLETFSELESKSDIFKRWQKIIDQGETISMGEATKDKIALSNGIIRLRSRLPMMEHVYYTLYDLTTVINQSSQVKKNLSDTTLRTLQIYEKRKREFMEKITMARYFFKIFIEIDKQASGQGLLPSSDLMEDFLLDEPLFITPPEPGGAGSIRF